MGKRKKKDRRAAREKRRYNRRCWKNWEMKMKDPVKPVLLSKEESELVAVSFPKADI